MIDEPPANKPRELLGLQSAELAAGLGRLQSADGRLVTTRRNHLREKLGSFWRRFLSSAVREPAMGNCRYASRKGPFDTLMVKV